MLVLNAIEQENTAWLFKGDYYYKTAKFGLVLN